MMRRAFAWIVLSAALTLVLGGAARRSDAEPRDLSGSWKISGQHSAAGSYSGTAEIARNAPGKYDITWSMLFKNGSTASLSGSGTQTGSQLLTTVKTGGAGAVDRLSGVFPQNVTIKGKYQLRALSSGSMSLYGTWWTEGARPQTKGSETLRRAAPATTPLNLRVDANGDGTIDAADDPIEEKAPGTFVGVGTAAGDRTPARLLGELPIGGAAKIVFEWSGTGAIKLYGPNGEVILAPGAARGESGSPLATLAGTALAIEGVTPGEGFLKVSYLNGSLSYTNRVRLAISLERVYCILWAYLGTEADYQPREFDRLKPIFDKLKSLGYVMYDDGTGHDQSKLDAAFEGTEATKNPKKLIIDRATSRADWESYMKRGSVRGILWAGHGFMQPFPGCPDSELLNFESRVWSCNPGDPTTNESRCFVREWLALVKLQRKLPMSFAILHSCATAGLGADYSDEPWHYCPQDIQDRVTAKFGSLPELSKLKFTTFDTLKPQVGYLVTYNGSAYFGMWDINLNEVIRSIKD